MVFDAERENYDNFGEICAQLFTILCVASTSPLLVCENDKRALYRLQWNFYLHSFYRARQYYHWARN
jgi:hypothetical protein